MLRRNGSRDPINFTRPTSCRLLSPRPLAWPCYPSMLAPVPVLVPKPASSLVTHLILPSQHSFWLSLRAPTCVLFFFLPCSLSLPHSQVATPILLLCSSHAILCPMSFRLPSQLVLHPWRSPPPDLVIPSADGSVACHPLQICKSFWLFQTSLCPSPTLY